MLQSVFATSDEFGADKAYYPFMSRPAIKWWQWLFYWLCIPLSWPQTVAYFESRPADKNCIKHQRKYMTGNLNSDLSLAISMRKSKVVAKQMGLTFNDLMLGIIGRALKVHFKKNKDDTDMITMSIPFTFQQISKDRSKWSYGNDFCVLSLYLPLREDLLEACKAAKQQMNAMKNSLIPVATYQVMTFYASCTPHGFMQHFSDSCGAKHTALFSNIPGFVKPVHFGEGGEATKIFCLGTGSGNIATGFSMISMPKQAQFVLTADES